VESLKMHMKKTHPMVQCDQCEEKFMTKRNLLVHKIKTHVVKCKGCDKRFVTKENLKMHMDSERCGDRKDTRVGCTKCIYVATSAEDLKAHMVKNHSKDGGSVVKPLVVDLTREKARKDCRFGQKCRFLATNSCRFNHTVNMQSQVREKAPRECRFGQSCRFLANKSCRFSHQDGQQSQVRERAPRECRAGLNCRFLASNSCRFNHKVDSEGWETVSRQRQWCPWANCTKANCAHNHSGNVVFQLNSRPSNNIQ
jgi:hypothetical protein